MGRARARPPARLHDLLLRGHLPVVARNPRARLRGPRRRLPSVAGAPPVPHAARAARGGGRRGRPFPLPPPLPPRPAPLPPRPPGAPEGPPPSPAPPPPA